MSRPLSVDVCCYLSLYLKKIQLFTISTLGTVQFRKHHTCDCRTDTACQGSLSHCTVLLPPLKPTEQASLSSKCLTWAQNFPLDQGFQSRGPWRFVTQQDPEWKAAVGFHTLSWFTPAGARFPWSVTRKRTHIQTASLFPCELCLIQCLCGSMTKGWQRMSNPPLVFIFKFVSALHDDKNVSDLLDMTVQVNIILKASDQWYTYTSSEILSIY